MLHEFITENREEVIRRTRALVAQRAAPQPTKAELEIGIPLFLDDLVATLRGGFDRSESIDRDASLHGHNRQRSGFTVAQVVHDYGDICQSVTQLAIELRAPIDTDEFKTLNRCLDDAIAHAVTEYSRTRERSIVEEEVERLGFLAHELRNHLQTASLSYEILRSGSVSIGGSTGAVLGRSLAGLSQLVDRTLAQVRLDDGVDHRERVDIPGFLEEIEAACSIAARDRDVSLTVERGDESVSVDADRQLLGSAFSNLLQNAIKFTPPRGHVRLLTTVTADRVSIDVEDQCGGLAPGRTEAFFDESMPRKQGGPGQGLGLGLIISKRAVGSMGGTICARNRPGIGCVFTIDMPRRPDD
jgi:signal transduction histidine kinase